jgi:putative ABC transport system permease protein
MEIGPIFRAMIQKKVGVVLLVAEIAVTMAVVLNCINMVIDNRTRLMIPSGLDEENIIVLSIQSFGAAFEEDEFGDQIRQQDLQLIRAQPGVIDATPIGPLPLQGGGSSTQRKVPGAVNDTLVRTPIYTVDEHFLETLGLDLAEGRAFTRADIPPRLDDDEQPATPPPINVIITKALGDALFPDGDALGQVITSANDQSHNTIIGIVDYMHTPYDDGASGMEYRIVFFPGRPGSASGMSYLVRAEPEVFTDLFTDLEERLATVNADRIIKTRSLMEIKTGGQFVNRFVVRVLSAIGVLLLTVTALGVYGMTSFTVTERTRQIGTRRALGARKVHIVRFFMVENAIITLLGIGSGLVLAFALNAAILSSASNATRLPLGLVLLGVVIVWGIGAVATLLPALRGASIPPIIATRSV